MYIREWMILAVRRCDFGQMERKTCSKIFKMLEVMQLKQAIDH